MKPLRLQRGVLLIILFVVLFMVGASLFITVMSNNVVNQQRDENTMDALSAAKDMLISYSVLQADYYGANSAGPGHLMCPDTDGDGMEDTPCGPGALGRLPVSINLPSGEVFPVSDYNNGIDQQFWYAISDEIRRNPAGVVNTTTAGNLTVDGQAGIAAVLIAPEELIIPQNRPSNNVADYLDAANTTAPDFVTSNQAAPESFNDRILTISSAEMIASVSARVAETIKTQLDAYHGIVGRYPRTQRNFRDMLRGRTSGGGRGGRGGRGGGGGGGLSPMPAWFTNNNWDAVSNYSQINRNRATVSFDNCNITYTLNFGTNTIGKDQSQC